ncbi:MAG: hypothetical protein QM763_23170 [Agriterribacter sp.]
MAQVKQLDFNGRTIFCGIDVHKKNWRVNIQDTEFELEDFSQDPDAGVLYKHLIQRYPGATFKACYEAGFSGLSLQRWIETKPLFVLPNIYWQGSIMCLKTKHRTKLA